MDRNSSRSFRRFFTGIIVVCLILWLFWRIGDWAGSAITQLPLPSAPFPTPTPTPARIVRRAPLPPPIPTPTPKLAPAKPALAVFDDSGVTAFSPDGTLILTGTPFGTTALLQRHDAKQLWSTKDNMGRVQSVAFSPDGRLFAVATELFAKAGRKAKGQVELRVTKSLAVQRQWLLDDTPYTVCFSPDAKFLAIRRSNENISLRRIDSGKDEWWYHPPDLYTNVSYGMTGGPRAVVFSPDGRFMAAANASGCIVIWRVGGDAVAYAVAEDRHQKSDIHTLLFSRDGKSLWSFGSNVTCWRAPWDFTLQTRRTQVRSGKTHHNTVSLSRDGQWIAACERGLPLYIWRVRDGRDVSPPQDITPHNAAALSFLPDGNLCGVFAQGNSHRSGELFSWKTAPVVQEARRKAIQPLRATPATSNEMPLTGVWAEPGVTAVAPGTRPSAPLLAGMTNSGEVFLIAPNTSKRQIITRLAGRTSSVEFSEDGTRFGVMGFGANDQQQRWEWQTAAPRKPLITPLNGDGMWWKALSRCNVRGRTLLVSIQNGAVTAYNAKSHAPVITLPGYGNRIAAMDVSPRGLVAVAYFKNAASTPPNVYFPNDAGLAVTVWDLATSKQLYTLPDCGQVHDLEFSPDGKHLAVGPAFPPLQLRAASNGKLLKTAQFYRGGVRYLAFSDDGTILRGLGETIYQEWRVR